MGRNFGPRVPPWTVSHPSVRLCEVDGQDESGVWEWSIGIVAVDVFDFLRDLDSFLGGDGVANNERLMPVS